MPDRRVLTPELLHQILRYDPDTGKIYWRERGPECFKSQWDCNNWNSRFAGHETVTDDRTSGYSGYILDCRVLAQRVAFSMYYEVHIEDLDNIDHINGDRKDNRIGNLRNVTPRQNARNRKLYKNNKTGHPGVCWRGDRMFWEATILSGPDKRFLGSFATREEAIERRKQAERDLGFHPNHARRGSPQSS